MIRTVTNFIDTLIFLWLAIRGMMFIYMGGGGYIIFWGCALICTAVFWKKLDKEPVVSSFENMLRLFKKN